MKSNNTQVLACGACAVIVDESGQMTTSVDALVNGFKRLFSGRGRSASGHRASMRAHA